jgi:hypothetical protein
MTQTGFVRFLFVLLPCTTIRFYAGENTFSFLWFLVLYLPIINWVVYLLLCAVQAGVGKQVISDHALRTFYVWYLNIPGALAVADLIYRGYVY